MCAKKGYDKRGAQSVINARTSGRQGIRRNRPTFLRAYACPKCRLWHVTHEREPR